MKALDIACDTSGHAHSLAALGYEALGFYARHDRCSESMIRGLRSVGIKLFTIWERGDPTHAGYFSTSKGDLDSREAVAFCTSVGMTTDKPIFAAVDYDPTESEIDGPITDYFAAFQKVCKSCGYLVGVYGSGQCCKRLIDKGLAHFGYLSQSKGFAGWEAFQANAAILQGPSETALGLDIDRDDVMDARVLW